MSRKLLPVRPDQSQIMRLLFALARSVGPAAMTGDGIAVRIAAGKIERTIHFPADVARAAITDDVVRAESQGLVLSDAGHARLARTAMPEAPFLAQHKPLVRRETRLEGSDAETLVDEAESPLAWLHHRRGKNGAALMSEVAFQAGERLRADFTRANLMPRMTANWDAAAASGRGAASALDFSDIVLAARQRVRSAMEAVGPELSGVLMDVCCFLKGLETVERERGWPARSGKVVLLIALERLAVYYGIMGEARGPDRAAGLTRWGAAGYRPEIRDRNDEDAKKPPPR